MHELVALPVWGAVVVAALAAVAVADRLAIPLLRFLIRRHRERTLEALNQRLSLPIRPYTLAGRRALTEQLMLDPHVQTAIEQEARASGKPLRAVAASARRYAREIVPAFSAGIYFRLGAAAARRLSTWCYRVRLVGAERAGFERIDPAASVVFVMNHRSNMDYVLVTHLASQRSALSYAVGEWARVPGLERLIRSMGGYFVRRDSSSPLYRRVLARYVETATQAGVTQAVFPEGGLTRDGALRAPKLGLISYIVAGFDPAGARDIVFVPVGLNYDRVLEDRIQLGAAATPDGKKPRFAFSPWVFVRFLWRNLAGRLTGSWYRYGYAGVAFGDPVSLRAHLHDRGLDLRSASPEIKSAEIERLGRRLIEAVGRAIPALPVPLAAAAFQASGGGPLSLLELKAAILGLMREVRRQGGLVHVPRQDEDYAVGFGLRMLTLRGILEERDGLLHANPRDRALIAYYANSIRQLIPAGWRPV